MSKTRKNTSPASDQDPSNMGGPAFHPDMPPSIRNRKDTPLKKAPMEILREDQVPPL